MKATVSAPRSRACFAAATVSGVVPECEQSTTRVSASTRDEARLVNSAALSAVASSDTALVPNRYSMGCMTAKEPPQAVSTTREMVSRVAIAWRAAASWFSIAAESTNRAVADKMVPSDDLRSNIMTRYMTSCDD